MMVRPGSAARAALVGGQRRSSWARSGPSVASLGRSAVGRGLRRGGGAGVERPRACSTDVHDAAAEWRHISIWPPSTPPSWELRWWRPPAGDAANGILGTAGDRWYYHPLGFALVFVPLPSYRSRSLRFLLQDAPWSDSGSTPALRCDRCCCLVCQEMNRCCMASIKTARTSGEQGEDQIRSCTGHRQSDEGRSRAGHAGRNEGDRARC
jgi:hypothetical protein